MSGRYRTARLCINVWVAIGAIILIILLIIWLTFADLTGNTQYALV